LLKHGHNNFTLEILEYCIPDELIKREQYYLDLIKPEYNILKNAYSLLGFKHSDETIAKLKLKSISEEHKKILSSVHLGKEVSQEIRDKLSLATTNYKKNNPLSLEALANIKAKTIKREGKAVKH
jgi:group I intron endonuclease